MWTRHCPRCLKPTVQSRQRKEREKMLCASCSKIVHYETIHKQDPQTEIIDGKISFFRICPECGEKVFYKYAYRRNDMRKRNVPCRKCFRMESILFPRFNRKACFFFDKLNKVKGWNGMHALNGGEYYVPRFHYYLDYYEPTQNLVIEWNEDHHKYQKVADKCRRENVIQVLGCKFLTIDKTWRISDIKS